MSVDRVPIATDALHELRKRSNDLPLVSVAIPVSGILLGELALLLGYLQYAVWSHAVTLLLCVSVPLVLTTDIRLLQAFSLIPLFRLVNLGMPALLDPTIYWMPLVYASLLPAIYVVVATDEKLSIRCNPRTAAILLLPSVTLAAVLAEIQYAIATPGALVMTWSIEQVILLAVIAIGFVALVEELVFRGIVQGTLEHRIGRWWGILIASVLFGLMHSVYGTEWGILSAILVGVILGVIYDRTASIELVILVHGTLNVFLFGIIPFHGSLLGLVT